MRHRGRLVSASHSGSAVIGSNFGGATLSTRSNFV